MFIIIIIIKKKNDSIIVYKTFHEKTKHNAHEIQA